MGVANKEGRTWVWLTRKDDMGVANKEGRTWVWLTRKGGHGCG